jgi:hypothetical protein
MTRLNAVEQWLKRVPLTAPLLGWKFRFVFGLVWLLRICFIVSDSIILGS